MWDRFEIDGRKEDGSEMTMQELIDYFKVSILCSEDVACILRGGAISISSYSYIESYCLLCFY